ncbi:hypothetical protein SAMN05444266_106500 [Chitinophaga jiangningensis]|uniref:Lipoprotein n=1 Tax=Chitinophaga jiangningensis TaxID=1419482 RepID=A0A1M7GC38_9BACT|nr:hypothetical protein [Chitinophaga jiangningensis]SHM13952.1 hypothetical protein SAMN05444266_106500 [Chitinophaga jiangningensis]
MRNHLPFYLLLTIFALVGCKNRNSISTIKPDLIKNDAKESDSIALDNLDIFIIDSVEFVRLYKRNIHNLNSRIKNTGCPTNFNAIEANEFEDEMKLFKNQVYYYKYKGSIKEWFGDASFVTDFYKKVMNAADDFYQFEQLRFVRFDSVRVADYGDCILASFRYLTPTSANQGRPSLMFNIDRSEVVLWDFSNLSIRKDLIELDFKVRNAKHTLYSVVYDVNSEQFLPHCYKIINE